MPSLDPMDVVAWTGDGPCEFQYLVLICIDGVYIIYNIYNNCFLISYIIIVYVDSFDHNRSDYKKPVFLP